jgi:RNA polymerase sigma factor (sigma-70 family)
MAAMQQPLPLTELPVARSVPACVALVRPPKGPLPHRLAQVRTPSRERLEQLFLAELPTIQRVVSSVARQHRLATVDAEDFAADVQLRIISDDYAVLRKFRPGCNLRAFLTVVIRRLFLDYRNAQWGRWRPSARSVREGAIAVRLEQLTVRDGFTFDEACDILAVKDKRAVNRNALERTFGRFRQRARPRFVCDDTAADRTPAIESADERLMAADAQSAVDRAAAVLRAALRATSAQDRQILKLRFFNGLSIATIARRLQLDQKRLYRRLHRLLNRLRATLERKGVLAADVLPALSRSDASLGVVFPPDDLVAMLRRAVHTETFAFPVVASPAATTVCAGLACRDSVSYADQPRQ